MWHVSYHFMWLTSLSHLHLICDMLLLVFSPCDMLQLPVQYCSSSRCPILKLELNLHGRVQISAVRCKGAPWPISLFLWVNCWSRGQNKQFIVFGSNITIFESSRLFYTDPLQKELSKNIKPFSCSKFLCKNGRGPATPPHGADTRSMMHSRALLFYTEPLQK